ncbi:hypothetical protein KX729_25695 [Rhizobium sp. XQZ8]|uniref:hypothetical protein n=1 Tax=Rhizobium populisoli TaxID=2859785 RepID=UPI001CA5D28B|nr:hypothetical protein [Rhizobium populisoli]MBW6424848.1 hypothetical protein [Rhizobium populisoli]
MAKIITNKPASNYPTEPIMTNFIDLADEEEPATVSEGYVARLAEYRRRLSLLRENLSTLNGIMEEAEAARVLATRTCH